MFNAFEGVYISSSYFDKKRRSADAVLTSAHNLCYEAKIRKKCIYVYHCRPYLYYVKVGYKEVYILIKRSFAPVNIFLILK